MFISLVYSCDIARILRPGEQTNEYPIFFVGYYCMMFAGFQLSSVKLRRLVLYTFLGLAFSDGILAVFQTYGKVVMPVMWGYTNTQAYGLTQNSNIFGGLSVLFVGASVGAFVFSKTRTSRIITGIISMIALYASYNAMSRLTWVGDITILLTFVISLLIMIKKDPKNAAQYKKNLAMLGIWVLFAAAVVVFSSFKNESFALRMNHIKSDMESIETGNYNALGSDRGYIWSMCMQSFPKHWVTGVGLDNLRWCYSERREWFPGMYASNQAHNEYIQVLCTQGVFAFINYFTLLIISVVKAVKRVLINDDEEDRRMTWNYLLMFAGFAVAMFFLFRAFNVEMYFFAVIGLMNPRVHNSAVKKI